jgi:hypothetical protein
MSKSSWQVLAWLQFIYLRNLMRRLNHVEWYFHKINHHFWHRTYHGFWGGGLLAKVDSDLRAWPIKWKPGQSMKQAPQHFFAILLLIYLNRLACSYLAIIMTMIISSMMLVWRAIYCWLPNCKFSPCQLVQSHTLAGLTLRRGPAGCGSWKVSCSIVQWSMARLYNSIRCLNQCNRVTNEQIKS